MKWRRSAICTLTLLVPLLGCLVPVRADKPADEKTRADEFLAFARRESDVYTFRLDAPGGQLLRREPDPILRWSNPVVGTIYGDVFVWTLKGRPELIGSLYQWYSPFTHRSNEFVSLSTGRIIAEREGQVVWAPPPSGIEWKPLPGAPVPAATAPQRLRQLRDMASEFTARQTDRKGVERDMRLLAQPVFRYEGAGGEPIDGAMFVFVLGTDPEAFLLIEDRLVEGKAQWQFSLVRMNSIELRVSQRGHEVWAVPPIPYASVADHSGPYTTFLFYPEAASKP
jgi:hypothetical protein